jgi:diguanylate cyclase (GGDEF)-like protein
MIDRIAQIHKTAMEAPETSALLNFLLSPRGRIHKGFPANYRWRQAAAKEMAEDLHSANGTGSGALPRFWEYIKSRKLLVLAAMVVVSYFLESAFDLNEMLDDFLSEYENVEADSFFIAAILPSLVFVLLQLRELRTEVKSRRSAEQAALEMALRDPLTGLGNRRKLEQAFTDLAPNRMHAVLMLDLDDFKAINDIFGHNSGDSVLIDAASRLISACGDQALVCRFGGDEFAILSPCLATAADAETFAQRVAAAFDDSFALSKTGSQVSTSIGISVFRSGLTSAEDAMRNADLALYRAKAHHQAGFCMYDPSMDEERRRRNLMEMKLSKAIELGDVRPHFQPLVDLKSGEFIGFEALARWTDPELGNVPPSEFIPLAEESGLINKLSDHLLTAACGEAARWPSKFKLSFNLSPRQLKDKQVGLRILKTLGDTGLSPQRLEVEVTESSLVEDKKLARQLLESLHNAGISIAIDDFGTGYSSLYHLREFKFDTLKIDRSFVMSMEPGNNNEVIVNMILGLSRGLGLKTTAEGIENSDQLSKLIASGCEQGQGYLFGKAMSAADVMLLINGPASAAQTA